LCSDNPTYSKSGKSTQPMSASHYDWPSCKGLQFETRFDLLDHQQCHYNDLIQPYESSLRCGWHACKLGKSGKKFQNRAALKRHVKQHIKSHSCPQPACNTDFARASDLARHIKNKHTNGQKFYCPQQECKYHDHGFARKDKLLEHTKKTHDNFRCPFDHCNAQVMEIEKDEHLSTFHSGKASTIRPSWWSLDQLEGVVECALTGCESTTSKFDAGHARRHFRASHFIDSWSALDLIRHAFTMATSASKEHAIVISSCRYAHVSCIKCAKTKGKNSRRTEVAKCPQTLSLRWISK